MVDAFVVGAGPAGATTAALLAGRGLQTLVVDKARFPRSKTCGEGMMPAGVSMLRRLGLEEEALARGARPFVGVRFFLEDGTGLTLDFRELDLDLHGLIWPRSELDGLLVDFARRSGAEVLEETSFRELSVAADGFIVGLESAGDRDEAHPRLVVAADGTTSRLHRPLGCRRRVPRPGRFGLRRRFEDLEELGSFVDVFFAPGGEAYVAPLGGGAARISLLLDESGSGTPDQRYEQHLEKWPGLCRRLAGARPVGPVESAAPISQSVSPPRVANALLVGDAAGSVDPITAQGLSLALHDARLAAEHGSALLGGLSSDLAGFFEARQRAFEPAFDFALQFLDVFAQPGLARRACRVLAQNDGLRAKVLRTATTLPPAPGLSGVDRLRLAVGV